MKYYMVSDIHGNYRMLMKLFDVLHNLEELYEEQAKICFLGDYIDEGVNSFRVLKSLYILQQRFEAREYKEGLVILRGNHEEAFIEFLNGYNDLWLVDDRDFITVKTFLTAEQFSVLKIMLKEGNINKISRYVRKKILSNHGDLIKWLKQLPYYYETEKQIMVHAGIDEEAENLWKVGTPNYFFVGKYPLTTGKFIKDVIAGHVSSAMIAADDDYLGKVYFDGENHYFIDGTINKTKKLPVLIYNTTTKKYSSIQIACDCDYESRFYIKGN